MKSFLTNVRNKSFLIVYKCFISLKKENCTYERKIFSHLARVVYMCLVFGLKYMTIHYEMLRIDDTLPRYRYKEGWSTHSTSKTILVYGFRSKKDS